MMSLLGNSGYTYDEVIDCFNNYFVNDDFSKSDNFSFEHFDMSDKEVSMVT